MREKNKRTFIIIALVVTILFIGVGYAALRQALVINGTASIGDASWDVKITDIKEGTLIGATTAENGLSHETTSATFSTILQYPGASASYVVTIANEGSINAILDSISGVDTANAAEPTELVFEVTGVNEGTTLNAGATNTATVTVTWVPNEGADAESIPTTTTKQATITLNYVQNPNPDETN